MEVDVWRWDQDFATHTAVIGVLDQPYPLKDDEHKSLREAHVAHTDVRRRKDPHQSLSLLSPRGGIYGQLGPMNPDKNEQHLLGIHRIGVQVPISWIASLRQSP